jgi:hypothetical protein
MCTAVLSTTHGNTKIFSVGGLSASPFGLPRNAVMFASFANLLFFVIVRLLVIERVIVLGIIIRAGNLRNQPCNVRVEAGGRKRCSPSP